MAEDKGKTMTAADLDEFFREWTGGQERADYGGMTQEETTEFMSSEFLKDRDRIRRENSGIQR